MSLVNTPTPSALTLAKSLPFISLTTDGVSVIYVSLLDVAISRFALIASRSAEVRFSVITGEFCVE